MFNKPPQANNSQSQVVGIDDALIGQAIAAILRIEDPTQDTTVLKQLAQGSVVAEFGFACRLTATYALAELGLDSFPMTATNKVHKAVLQDSVRERMKSEQKGQSSSSSASGSTLDSIMEIWQQVLATGSSEIGPETSITQIAESLVLMQFCSLVGRG